MQEPSFLDGIKNAAAALFSAVIPAPSEEIVKTIQMGDSILGGAIGAEPVKLRTHHKLIHPTKGWRGCSRPAGTNRRRRLIPALASSVPGSHEANRRERSGGRLPKLTNEQRR
jgi:hypothetical protein